MPFQSVSLDRFMGLDNSPDELNLIPGQLRLNQNYLYLENGGLSERGGGEKIDDPPSAGVLYGLSSFTNDSDDTYLVCAQGTDLHYYDSGSWNALSLTLTGSQLTRFEQAGFGAARSLYAVNGTERIIKITMTTGAVTASILAAGGTDNAPAGCKYLKLHKNRLFASDGADTVYFTDTLAFDTWASSTNNFQVDPGINGNIQSMEVWGDALFIFKETAVYVLVNADASVSDFKVLKTDAYTGTKSPDSVQRTRRGLFYFSEDGFIRNISPSISFSSNEFTLGGSGSPIVSYAIQDYLRSDYDRTDIANIQAFVHNDLYVLSYKSTENTQAYQDRTFFADTNKSITYAQEQTLQPFWGQFTGFQYRFMHIVNDIVYGAKGLDGEVHTTLTEGVYNDSGSAIESKAKIGWFAVGGSSLYKRFNRVVMKADGQTYPISLFFNSYRTGSGSPPDATVGISKSLVSDSWVLVGSAIVGPFPLSAPGVTTQEYTTNLNGNYFQAQFQNLNVDQPTKIFGLDLIFRSIRIK